MKFSKDYTLYVKGIAIFSMLIYHLFGKVGNIPSTHVSWWMQTPFLMAFQICVPIYLFMAGFGLECVSERQKVTFYTQFKRVKKLYVIFWKYGIPFIVIASVHNVLVNNSIDVKSLILEIIGLYTPDCGTWWFFSLYVELCFIFIILNRVRLSLGKYLVLMLFVFVSFRLMLRLNPNPSTLMLKEIKMILIELNIFWLGVFFAKFHIFDWVIILLDRKHISKYLLLLIGALLIISQIWVRAYIPMKGVTELVGIPFVIVGSIILFKNGFLPSLIISLGKYSTQLWLVHSFFINYYPYGITTVSRNPIIMFALLMIQSFCYIIFIDYLNRRVIKLLGCN